MVRRVAGYFLKPIVKWYLKKERKFNYKDIEVLVPVGVFHPGLFSSTNFLLEFLSGKDIKGNSLLELGSGSGLISIFSAKRGAKVVAVDLSKAAVEATRRNAERNGESVLVIQSDLFHQIPAQTFEWIVINPPFYPRKANNDEELAWYCGEEHQYFNDLFETISSYVHSETNTVMVLSEDCDLVTIDAIAKRKGFKMEKIMERRVFLFERNFLFLISSFD